MRHHTICFFTLIFLLCLPTCNKRDAKKETKEKYETVISLMEKLHEKHVNIDNTIKKFKDKKTEFKKAIKGIKSKRGISSYAEAENNKPLMIHLTAYQKVEAYLKILKEEDKKTEQAAIELYGIQMQLELDIEMLESIENADLEEHLSN